MKELEKAILKKSILSYEHFLQLLNVGNIFVVDEHRKIYETMFEMNKRYLKIDILLLKESLNDDILSDYIDDIVNNNYGEHFNEYINKIQYRNITATLREYFENNQTEDPKQLIFEMVNMIFTKGMRNILHVKDYILSFMGNQKKASIFIPAGIEYFDNRKGGFEKKTSIIVAARPSDGKTSFMLNLGAYMAKSGLNIGMLSSEESSDKIFGKIICSDISCNTNSYMQRTYNKEIEKNITDEFNELYEKNIVIDDTSPLYVEDLNGLALMMKNKYKIDVLFLDYIQRVRSRSKNMSTIDRVELVAETMKDIAKNIDVVSISLCQMNRKIDAEKNDDGTWKREPEYDDLKGSGGIEQSGDVIIFLEPQLYYEGPEKRWKLIHHVKKDRDGEKGKFGRYWIKEYSKIYDYFGIY